MKQFHLSKEYFTYVVVKSSLRPTKDVVNPETGKIVMLRGESYGTTGSKDHDKFTELRELLYSEGYINIQRGWCNGDQVIKDFRLNNVPFLKGEKFCGAGALNYTMGV